MMTKYILTLLLYGASLSAMFMSTGNWFNYADFDMRAGSYAEGAGATFFLPVWQHSSGLLFVEAAPGYWKDGQALDFGAGYRQKCGSVAIGINGFFDYAYTKQANYFVQGGAGFEVIGPCWIVRGNAYLNGAQKGDIVRRRFPSGFFLEEQVSYWGGDVEVGYSRPLGIGWLWGYIGYYDYRRGGQPKINGPRARVEFRVRDFFTWCATELYVGGEYEYDNVRKGEGAFIGGFRFPLTCCRPKCRMGQTTCTLMNRKVWRQRGIWTQKRRRFIPNS